MLRNRNELRESRLVRIDSRDRSAQSKSAYDLKVDFNDYLLHNVTQIMLKSCYIPNTAYNVNQYKNVLTYNAGAGVQSVTVTPGQYTLTELMAELTTELAAAVPAVTLTYVYDTNTGKLTFNTAPATVIYASSTIAELLGIGDNDLPSSVSHAFPNVINLSGLQKVYIGSHTAAKGTTMTSSDKNHIKIFTEIPIKVAFGSVEHRVLDDLHSMDSVTHSVPFNLSSMDLTLYDQDLNVLDLNGAHYQIVLKAYP